MGAPSTTPAGAVICGKPAIPAAVVSASCRSRYACTTSAVESRANGGPGVVGSISQEPEKDPEDGAVPLLTCCLSETVKSGEFYEPEHTSRGPAKLTQLEPISLEADRAALWSASEAAIGEKWEL